MEKKPKYKTSTEWRKAEPNAYASALRLGILPDIFAKFGWETYSKPIIWTKEKCAEEAKKFTMKEHWKKHSGNSYAAARRNGWYDELSSHMVEGCKPKNFWTKEKCAEEAKKFTMKEHWKKQHPPSYQAAQRNGWVNELTSHMENKYKNNGYWTKERCIEEARKYNSINEWSTLCKNASIQVARIKGWMDECTSHMVITITPPGYWTKERCIESAKKYNTKSEWIKGCPSYQAARIKGWIDECTTHMVPLKTYSTYWTKERCIEKAKDFNTIREWQLSKGGGLSYKIAKQNGWVDECTAHFVRKKKPSGYWTKERCIEEARKYNSIKEWKIYSCSSQTISLKKDWYEECIEHMGKKYGKKTKI